MEIGYIGINFSLTGFILAMLITIFIKKKKNSKKYFDLIIKILFTVSTVSIVTFLNSLILLLNKIIYFILFFNFIK